jgi:hypothetical protein
VSILQLAPTVDHSCQVQYACPFHQNLRPSQEHTQPPIQWKISRSESGQSVKVLDESPPCSARIKSKWSYTSTSLMYLRGMRREKILNKTLGFADGIGILLQDKDRLSFPHLY